MTGNDMAQCFEVANVEMLVLRRGWTMPVFISGKIETGKAREVLCPYVAGRIHGHSDVGFVFQERDPIPMSKGFAPPPQFRLTCGVQ